MTYTALMATQWVQAPGVITRAALGQVVLLAPGSTEPVAIVAPADALWELLADPRDLEQLVGELSNADVDDDVVRAAISDVLQRLTAAGVVTRGESAS